MNTESDLIGDILSGNQNQFRVLIDRYSPVVFYIVRRFVKDEDEVQELAQQIFIKVFEKLESFKKESSFSSWIYIIAMNHCRDYAKNVRRNNIQFSEIDSNYLDANWNHIRTPHMQLEMKEWKELLNAAMKKLSKDYAEPFLMKYRDGMSYQVMEEKTGVSVTALKVRVHRARKELKDILNKQVT